MVSGLFFGRSSQVIDTEDEYSDDVEKRASGAVGGQKWIVDSKWCVPPQDFGDLDFNHLDDSVDEFAPLIPASSAKKWIEAINSHFICTTKGLREALSRFVYTVRVAPVHWNKYEDFYVVNEEGNAVLKMP